MDNGTSTPTTYTNGNQPLVYQNVPANVRVLSGRTTSIPVYLDDAALSPTFVDPTTGLNYLDRTYFNKRNYFDYTQDAKIEASYADAVMFDISNVGTKAVMQTTGNNAQRIYFTGDAISLSEGTSTGKFESLNPYGAFPGTFTSPVQISSQVAPGTYLLTNSRASDDPTQPPTKYPTILGTWRSYTEVIANPSTFELIAFPNSGERAQFDLAAMVRDASGKITDFYYGIVDVQANTVQLYPLSSLQKGSVTNQINGTLTAVFDSSGAAITSVGTADISRVRTATVSFSGSIPSGFKQTARLLVFRI